MLDSTGSWMEFGVFEGGTINGVANYRKKNCDADPNSNFVYGFDTFTGLPEAWGEFRPSVSFLLSSQPALAYSQRPRVLLPLYLLILLL